VPPEVRIHVDGGARGNPGPAGFGVVVSDAEGATLGRYFGYLGVQTNNAAEYRGLIAALEHARHSGWRRLWIGSDSELMVRQVRGQYKVKNEGLRPLYERCRQLIAEFEEFAIEHVPRAGNAEADSLANQAMNLRGSELPPGAGSASAPPPAGMAAASPPGRHLPSARSAAVPGRPPAGAPTARPRRARAPRQAAHGQARRRTVK